MKKYLLFTCVLLLFLCIGCQNSSKDKLVICTDSYSYNQVKLAVDRWKTENHEGSSIETEIITIPKDEAAAEIKIAEIRTEIMSGDGPDLFIIRVASSLVATEDRQNALLFSNPEKAMYSDIFLPLDSYLEEFESLNIDNCNQAVLSAGQTEKGQMLLPLVYSYQTCIFPTDENEESASYPKSLEDIIADEQMKQAIYRQNIQGFFAYLGLYADYKNEELLISKEDIMKQYELCLSDEKQWSEVQLRQVELLYDELRNSNQSYDVYAIPNISGGVTGNVILSAGINKNTRFADEAASLLDTYIEVLKNGAYALREGMFIELDEQLLNSFRSDYYLLDEDIESILKMNDTITEARFYSTWDYELADAYWELKWGAQRTIEPLVDEIYNKMQMQIKE